MAQICLAWVAASRGDLDRCIGWLRPVVDAAAERQWHGILMAARLLLASMLAEQAQVQGAHAVIQPAQVIADTIGDLRSRVLTRYVRAYIHWCAGEHEAATDWAQAALTLGGHHLQRMDLIHLRRTLGVAQLALGEWQTALALADENIAAASAAGMHLDEALAIGLRGQALALLGEPEAGHAAIVDAISRLRRLGAERLARSGLSILAQLGLPGPGAESNG